MALKSFLTRARQKFFAAFGRPSAGTIAELQSAYNLLSRFIFHRTHFGNGKPKASAFLPQNLRTSAFWIDDLPDADIWEIGDQIAGRPRSLRSIARADFTKKDVKDIGLGIESDPAPHPRHVDVIGWPPDKAEQKSIALDLCARAQLLVRPIPNRSL